MRRMKHHSEENYDMFRRVKEVKQQENRYSFADIAKTNSRLQLRKYKQYRERIGEASDIFFV